ncbi:hypothetical protein [Candidatus Skiveiella danica]|uniref:hypothetical protein n=1 Tax=Candidatus Skiveiella danica TaxID=3386177 RepID=UPI0039B9C85A
MQSLTLQVGVAVGRVIGLAFFLGRRRERRWRVQHRKHHAPRGVVNRWRNRSRCVGQQAGGHRPLTQNLAHHPSGQTNRIGVKIRIGQKHIIDGNCGE